jgi:DNA-binding NtrC family response regulator
MKKNILLIDDNKYLLDVFVIRLTMSLGNYRVLTARNGKQGIEILKSTRVEFVLTDLDMPEMDGYQFVEYCREHFAGVPVFAMSNECSLSVNERLQALGIMECIEKPFLVEEVTHKIMRRLKGEKVEAPRELPDSTGAYLLSIIPN